MGTFLHRVNKRKSKDWIDSNEENGSQTITEHENEKKSESRLCQLISGLDTGIKDVSDYSQKLLSSLASEMEASQGMFYLVDNKKGVKILRFLSGYAIHYQESEPLEFEFGQGFPGQVAQDGKILNIRSIPEGYVTLFSGLGKSSPRSLILFPVLQKNRVLAVIELASFREFSKRDEEMLSGITPHISDSLRKLANKN